MRVLTCYGEAHAVTCVVSASGLRAIVNQLRMWPTDVDVVTRACLALNNMMVFGEPAIHAIIGAEPDCVELLKGCNDVHGDACSAALTLLQLGVIV